MQKNIFKNPLSNLVRYIGSFFSRCQFTLKVLLFCLPQNVHYSLGQWFPYRYVFMSIYYIVCSILDEKLACFHQYVGTLSNLYKSLLSHNPLCPMKTHVIEEVYPFQMEKYLINIFGPDSLQVLLSRPPLVILCF